MLSYDPSSLLHFGYRELRPFRGEEKPSQFIFDEGEENRHYHWWLEDIENETRIDITASQFDKLPYDTEYAHASGIPRKWYSFKETPSSKTFKVIKRIQPTAKHYITTIPPTEDCSTLEAFM